MLFDGGHSLSSAGALGDDFDIALPLQQLADALASQRLIISDNGADIHNPILQPSARAAARYGNVMFTISPPPAALLSCKLCPLPYNCCKRARVLPRPRPCFFDVLLPFPFCQLKPAGSPGPSSRTVRRSRSPSFLEATSIMPARSRDAIPWRTAFSTNGCKTMLG